jgi:sortase B
MQRNKRKKKKIANRLLMVSLSLGIILSLVYLLMTLFPYYEGREIYSDIQKTVTIEPQTPENPNINTMDLKPLLEVNEEVVGWIRFDEPSVINYPIMQTTDNEKYLHYAWDGTENILGAIFLDKDNSANFQDQNTYIYGHNMSYGGAMFTKLNQYAKKEFALEYPYFYIFTLDGTEHMYQVIGASIMNDESPLYQVSFNDNDEFLSYIQNLQKEFIYTLESSDITVESKIVNLITCTDISGEQRFVLHGKLVS